ncbi:hypothetical protein EV660_11733 [Roseinatronobacter bogoriensis DSM 18756]|nr:hypothetical protein [Rhodobaca bogoriensis DSM 18756]TDY65765.1 hypothetical protein EV660_11733 [Rhodobaca bogoriensis DSM 18756]
MGRDDGDDRDDKCGVPRVRARDVFALVVKGAKGILTRRWKISSLSSLSSLLGGQGIEKTGKDLCDLAQKNVPFFGVIVPIVPELRAGKQQNVCG